MPYKQKICDYVIYKLICNDEALCSEIYVGSTVDCATRKQRHKNVCNNPNGRDYNLNVYQIIRANGGWFSWKMVPIEVISNTTKREAEIVEESYRVSLNANMNTNKASIGNITVKEYKKQHYNNNKEQIDIKQKLYRIDNKNKISIKRAHWYCDNKDTISINNKIKIECECGCLVNTSNLTRHKKTLKHQQFMETKEN
jgi:hypothetical protein